MIKVNGIGNITLKTLILATAEDLFCDVFLLNGHNKTLQNQMEHVENQNNFLVMATTFYFRIGLYCPLSFIKMNTVFVYGTTKIARHNILT